MKLSIITINYNNANGLQKTIESVINQKYQLFEYLIIDGGSTDESFEILNRYSDKISRWLSEKDNGIYDAMNKGIRMAKGEYLMFLNSGDALYNEEIISICIEKLELNSDVDILYGNVIFIKDKQTFNHTHPKALHLNFFKNQNLNHQSSFFRATLFDEFGLYPTIYVLAGDHWLFLKSFIMMKKYMLIERPIVYYDSAGLSFLHRNKYDEEMAKIWNNEIPSYVDDLVIYTNELIAREKHLKAELNKKFIRRANKLYDYYLAIISPFPKK